MDILSNMHSHEAGNIQYQSKNRDSLKVRNLKNICKQVTQKLQEFVNKCLRIISQILWPDRINNFDLWSLIKMHSLEHEIREMQWKWIKHTMRKPEKLVTWSTVSLVEEKKVGLSLRDVQVLTNNSYKSCNEI